MTEPRRRTVRSALVGAVLLALTACSGAATTAESGSVASSPVPSSSAPVQSAPSSSAPSSSTASSPSAPSPSPESVAAPSPSSFVPAAPPPPIATGPILPASIPTVLEVPSIGVRSDLMSLGQNADGTIQVPDVDDPASPAGWYNGSPTPGELGPSILLGHVDSRKLGPGVFYDLDKLQPGAEIRVTREDGTVAIFQVDRVTSYAKLDFPTLSVYGNLDHAGLRLITCGGVFDAAAGSYESNIVAYATLVGQA